MYARLPWLILGLVCTGLGLAGLVLPLLPTTPFLLVAAYAFGRSSQRLNEWLLAHRHFGPMIANWRRYGAISRRAKILAMVFMTCALAASWIAGVNAAILVVQAVVMLGVAAFILTRPGSPGDR
jgi:uncharacterized membrane protein YbaN (DUF454 family)